MASLINSIFGGGTPVAGSDLFESKKFSVPLELHTTFAAAKNSTTNHNSSGKDDVMEAPTTSKDFRSGVGSVDDKPLSSTTTLEDAPSSSSFTSPENACTTKKTMEELKEEEERTIFVGNLPPDISRRSLAGIFKPCGSVASTRLRSIAVAGVKLPPEQAGNQVRERESLFGMIICIK